MYDLSALTDELEILSEEKLRIFNQKLIPETGRRILGVRTPALRRIARTPWFSPARGEGSAIPSAD